MQTKYLGIDYGTKKVGIAVSDDSGALAFPDDVVPNDKAFYESLQSIIARNHVTKVVIGQSLGKDGSENAVMEGVHDLRKRLETDGLEVFLEPEFFTTAQAKRHTADKMADASAAALILQSFLDKLSRE